MLYCKSLSKYFENVIQTFRRKGKLKKIAFVNSVHGSYLKTQDYSRPKKASEYCQEMPQSYTADQLMAMRGKNTEH